MTEIIIMLSIIVASLFSIWWVGTTILLAIYDAICRICNDEEISTNGKITMVGIN